MATEIFAKSVLSSSTALSPTLHTIHMKLPRFILAELNTHRIKSKNSRSSRAVPIATMIKEAAEDPVIPIHWGLAQKGMQAYEENNRPIKVATFDHLSDTTVEEEISNVDAWLRARDAAVYWAERFAGSDYHKQVVNRLLEPFLHVHSLVSSTTWANFIWLRDHHAAEPHIQELARCVIKVLAEVSPQELKPGEWHLPFIKAMDIVDLTHKLGHDASNEDVLIVLKQISAARCARISYKPFDGNGSTEAELNRYQSLVSSDRVHASPVEHQATPDTQSYYRVEKITDNGEIKKIDVVRQGMDWDNPTLHGNYQGWIQFRKTIPNEAVW